MAGEKTQNAAMREIMRDYLKNDVSDRCGYHEKMNGSSSRLRMGLFSAGDLF